MSISNREVIAEIRRTGNADALVESVYTGATLVDLTRALLLLACREGDGVLIVGVDPHDGGEWHVSILTISAAALSGHAELPLIFGKTLLLCGLGPGAAFVLGAVDGAQDSLITSPTYITAWSYDPALVFVALNHIEQSLTAAQHGLREQISALRSEFTLHQPAPDQLSRFAAGLTAAMEHSRRLAQSALHDLEERLRWREDQARMVVHDMRTPLHTLMISVNNLLARELPREMQRELLEVARDTVTNLLNLSETMLQISRLEAGLWPLRLEREDIVALARDACRLLEIVPRPNQAPISFSAAMHPLLVMLDRRLIERVLMNLLVNAIKYTPASGTIMVEIAPDDGGRCARVTISDTGRGISSEIIPYIFERFYQARNEDRSHGVGFGLYFSQLAIKAHGGSISVESMPGVGSAFTIMLPLDGV